MLSPSTQATNEVASREGEKKQEGNFTPVPNEVIEFLMNRKKADLTSREYALMFFLIRELQGWAYEFKPIQLSDFIEGTGIEKQNILPALESLVTKRNLIKKVKLPGYRTPLYGFNKEIFGRILASQEPKKFFSSGKGKVINLMTFKVLNSMPLEVIESMTNKRHLQAVEAAERAAKDISNTCKYNLREISEFLKAQRKQNRERWEGIINGILERYPRDELLLWKTIELVHKTQKDLFGNPIRRSILGLFEGDWAIMRVSMEARLNQMEMERIKKEKREENEKRMAEVKKILPFEEQPFDLEKMNPAFRKFMKQP